MPGISVLAGDEQTTADPHFLGEKTVEFVSRSVTMTICLLGKVRSRSLPASSFTKRTIVLP